MSDPSTAHVGDVAEHLNTDIERGLTAAEAARRLVATGPNELEEEAPVPAWRKFLAQFQDPLIYLLIAAVVVAFIAWLVDGSDGVPFDVIVIVIIVILNAVLGYVQEARAEEAVAELQKMNAPTASVIRDGKLSTIPAAGVVPGDLLSLGEGDTIAADARLVTAATLKVAEASLTGESEPVLKNSAVLSGPAALGDRFDMVFSGTAVTQGVGRAIVTGTGMNTEMGRIADLLQRTQSDPTPLQREISRVGKALGIAVIVIAVVVMATVFVTSDIRTADDVITVLLLGVSLAVAAVPEGLPAILSVVLALGVQRMARKQAIVKKLSSVETLGSATVICSDKTGTLTRNEMTIERVVSPSGEATFSGIGYRPDGEMAVVDGADPDTVTRETQMVIAGGSLANDAELREENGVWTVLGDPTEAAFLVAERKLGITQTREARFERIGEVPFTSERKLMTSLETDTEFEGTIDVITKGAPDVLVRQCTSVRIGPDVVPLNDEMRAQVLADVERLSGQALRTLSVAYRQVPADEDVPTDESIEHEMTYLGMVGIIDPPRTEVADAIAEAHRAGIRVIMITGDHPATAARIAADLGIVEPGEPVLTGPDLEAMSKEEFVDQVREVSVYARVAPQHKLDIIDALQEHDEIVAMTGDGVNDAPALKSADIGVAMGITGTEVTKQAGTMILADDNFATIVAAVREGRSIFDNIKKFLRYLLSSNVGEVLTVFLGVMFAGFLGLAAGGEAIAVPLLAVQILWINLLTDTGPALAMGVDPAVDDPMARAPRGLSAPAIDAAMWRNVFFIGVVMAMVTLLSIDIYLPGGFIEGSDDLTTARTVGFTTLVLCQLFNCFNARSERVSAFRHVFVNGWLWAAVTVSLLLQVAVVYVPLLNDAFGTRPLTLEQWLVSLGLASFVLIFSEVRKVITRAISDDPVAVCSPVTQ